MIVSNNSFIRGKVAAQNHGVTDHGVKTGSGQYTLYLFRSIIGGQVESAATNPGLHALERRAPILSIEIIA